MMMKLFLALTVACSAWGQIIDSTCDAAIDIYFVCDNSRSVGDGMRTSGVEFLSTMINTFDGPNFQTQIVYFSASAQNILPLTGDRVAMANTLDTLRTTRNVAGTRAYTGLEIVRRALQAKQQQSSTRFSLVFLLTDGMDQRFEQMEQEAQLIREMGVYLFGIGIGDYDRGQLSAVVSTPTDRFFTGIGNYDALPALALELAEEFCIEVDIVTPSEFHVCHNRGVLDAQVAVFEARGVGFDVDYLTNPVHLCRFILDDNEVENEGQVTVGGTLESDFVITCSLPLVDFFDENNPVEEGEHRFALEVSLDGNSFTESRAMATIVVSSCPAPLGLIPVPSEPSEPFDPTPVLLVAAPILLFLIWFLWPLMCRKKKVASSLQPLLAEITPIIPQTVVAVSVPALVSEPAAPAKPIVKKTRKWAVVDTSNYIWARSGGGAAPLHCQWGELGATANAPGMLSEVIEEELYDLALDVKPISEAETPASLRSDSETVANDKISCCQRLSGCVCYLPLKLCSCLDTCYTKMASLRPGSQ